MIYRLKGIIQFYLFLFGFRWGYVIGLVGFILGIIGPIIEPPASIFGFSLAFISIILGIIIFMRDTKELKQTEKDLYEIKSTPEQLKSLQKSERYDNYEFISFREYYALYSQQVNYLLANTDLRLEIDSQKFHLDSVARSIAPFILRAAFKSKAILFNSPKPRLRSDLIANKIASGNRIVIQQTDYFSGLCTNEVTCREIWSRSSKTRLFDGLSFMSDNQIILDLEESKCSNHIGISTIAFTADGKMVITVQSAESAQSANLLAPSGSGSVDFSDLKKQSNTFQDFIISAMERELIEECGISGNVNRSVKTHLIGFARLLNRGGKPEFFGLSILNIPFDSLKILNKEAVFISDITGTRVNRTKMSDFKDSLAKFYKERQKTFSFLLYLNLRFLIEYLESSPDFFLRMVDTDRSMRE